VPRRLRATGWDLSVCHVYHLTFNGNNDPDGVAEGPGPPPLPPPPPGQVCPPIAFMCP